MAKSKGYVFEGEIRKSAEVLNIYYQKISVSQKGKIKLKTSPFDGFLVHEGRFIPLEMKSQVVYKSFPLSNIKEHQIEGLEKAVGLGCRAFILFNQRSIVEKGKRRVSNRCWAIDFSRWNELIEKLGARKSIPTSMFESGDLLFEVPRIHTFNSSSNKQELVWDLTVLLNENSIITPTTGSLPPLSF